MNAAETIAAAIEKLEGLKSNTSPGPWSAVEDNTLYSSEVWKGPHGHVNPRPIFMAEGNWVSGYAYIDDDADLIVTLHRTIDALLAILRIGLEAVTEDHMRGLAFDGPVLDLARAILGAVSS